MNKDYVSKLMNFFGLFVFQSDIRTGLDYVKCSLCCVWERTANEMQMHVLPTGSNILTSVCDRNVKVGFKKKEKKKKNCQLAAMKP